MAEQCSNKVSFLGGNSSQAIDHFAEMGDESPPFYALIIEEDTVWFESKWIPPLRDLNEIAERFDVSYDLVYQLPDERAKQKHHYACLNDQPLGPAADALRRLVLAAPGRETLDVLEEDVHAQADLGQIDLHEQLVLSELIGKQYGNLSGNRQRGR